MLIKKYWKDWEQKANNIESLMVFLKALHIIIISLQILIKSQKGKFEHKNWFPAINPNPLTQKINNANSAPEWKDPAQNEWESAFGQIVWNFGIWFF